MQPYKIDLPQHIKNMLLTLEEDVIRVIINSKTPFIAPIEIMDVVNYYKIDYSVSTEFDYRGHAIVEEKKALIEINANLMSDNAKRFTIAHELGHIFSYQFQGKHGKVHYDENTSAGKDPEEIYANAFASSILVPKDLLINQLKVNREIQTIAKIFAVSNKVIEYRVKRIFGNNIKIISHNNKDIVVDI
jgi:Zn-dependent peptidase ImmA (M78 family)